jgi:hypothetical protein
MRHVMSGFYMHESHGQKSSRHGVLFLFPKKFSHDEFWRLPSTTKSNFKKFKEVQKIQKSSKKFKEVQKSSKKFT